MPNFPRIFIFSFLLTAISNLPLPGQFSCGTDIPENPISIDRDDLMIELVNLSSDLRKEPRIFKVSIHVIRNSNGSGGISKSKILRALEQMNNDYLPANITFEMCGDINYIDESKYSTIKKSEANALAQKHNINKTINIYFVNNLKSDQDIRLCGFSSFPEQSNRKIFMNNNCVDNGSTLSHEMGHFFGLFHTHETFFGKERVARVNCTVAGDRFCDTPADPRLSYENVTNCRYYGDEKDDAGVAYMPDVSNLMSYAPKKCRTHFSDEQYAYMSLIAKTSNKYILSTCNLPDLSVKPVGENSIDFKLFEDIHIDLEVDNLINEVSDSFTVKIAGSKFYDSFGKKLTVTKVAFESNKNTLRLELKIPFSDILLNSKYLNVKVDADQQIDELNESNNTVSYELNYNNSTKNSSYIFPNPVGDNFNLLLDDPLRGRTIISIFDASNRFISSYSFNKLNRYLLYKFDDLRLPSGMYYLKIKINDSKTKILKFIKH